MTPKQLENLLLKARDQVAKNHIDFFAFPWSEQLEFIGVTLMNQFQNDKTELIPTLIVLIAGMKERAKQMELMAEIQQKSLDNKNT